MVVVRGVWPAVRARAVRCPGRIPNPKKTSLSFISLSLPLTISAISSDCRRLVVAAGSAGTLAAAPPPEGPAAPTETSAVDISGGGGGGLSGGVEREKG